jgi:glycosyltransferase involved in cell wall biosynthesis
MLAERTLIEWSRVDADPTTECVVRAAAHIDADERSKRQLLANLLRALPNHRPCMPEDPLTHLQGSGLQGAGDGIVVIQPFLHACIDRTGSALGAGDAGGIAALLRSLGAAVANIDDVDEVITVTRRDIGEARTELLVPCHRVERIAFGPGGVVPWREAWVHRTEIERRLLAIGKALSGRRVVWHLRMADVGTLAAAAVARRLGQPVVFTAAPDPHIVIDALQDSGQLDRSRFAIEDAASQYWFRARMVERLTAQADHLALLPRPTIERELVELVGVEPADLAARSTVIAEGVDVGESNRARALLEAGIMPPAVRQIVDSLPVQRRRLPWLLTVGRLHPSKGPQRIVDAVVAHPDLAACVNIVIVGGDIHRPSADEQSTIELIRRAAGSSSDGLVSLTGHLPPTTVADLMAFVAAHGGVYVCASDKEEFGLSIVEALAAGAVVVAPERGGPASYVDDGDTGVLCDTRSRTQLSRAMQRALGRATDLERAERSRAMVQRELSVDCMARRLVDVYQQLVPSAVNV